MPLAAPKLFLIISRILVLKMKNWLSVSWFTGLCLLLILSSWVNPKSHNSTFTSCISYIPTAISPNGDGINDQFRVQCECDLETYSLQIFNISEEVVYASSDAKAQWNGKFKGTPVPIGKYTWIIEYQAQNGQKALREGELVLIR